MVSLVLLLADGKQAHAGLGRVEMREYISPITANCASMRGEQSTLAPTSNTTTGDPSTDGKMPASAGRSRPAPRLARSSRWPSPRRCCPRHEPLGRPVADQPRGHAQRAVPLRFERAPRALLMVTRSLACTISMEDPGSLRAAPAPATTSCWPTRITLTTRPPGGSNRPVDFGLGGVGLRPLHPPQWSACRQDRYSSTTSTTSRPLYCAMRAYTVGELGLMELGHSARPTPSAHLRAAGAGPPLGVSAFGIRHISISTSKFLISGALPSDRRCSRFWQSHAVSFGSATGRANTFAVFAASPLHGQSQQHLFPKDVLQLQAAPS